MSLSLWDLCLSQLEVELSEQQLNTWIRPLQAREQSNCLTLMAPNQFVCDWVQTNFYSRIQELALALSTREGFFVALQIGSGQVAEPEPSAEAPTLDLGSNAGGHLAGATQPSSDVVASVGNSVGKNGSRARANLNPAYNFETFVEGKSNQLLSLIHI